MAAWLASTESAVFEVAPCGAAIPWERVGGNKCVRRCAQ